jgi:hypothetical protein
MIPEEKDNESNDGVELVAQNGDAVDPRGSKFEVRATMSIPNRPAAGII